MPSTRPHSQSPRTSRTTHTFATTVIPTVGAAVAATGAGVVLPPTAAPERIRDAIRRLLSDGPHRAAASAIGTRLPAQDGQAPPPMRSRPRLPSTRTEIPPWMDNGARSGLETIAQATANVQGPGLVVPEAAPRRTHAWRPTRPASPQYRSWPQPNSTTQSRSHYDNGCPRARGKNCLRVGRPLPSARAPLVEWTLCGGTLRDVLVRRIPAVLESGLYAIPAIIGAAITVATISGGVFGPVAAVAAAASRYGLNAPRSPGQAH